MLIESPTMNPRIVLYSKPGCHLCDLARDDLDLLGFEMNLAVETVDITTDPALLQRYQALIPVVDVDGGPLLTPPITLGRLREALVQSLSLSLAPDRASDAKALSHDP
jgi:hypothetical protein